MFVCDLYHLYLYINLGAYSVLHLRSVCCCFIRCYDRTYQIDARSGVCEPVPDCSVEHCLHGDCVVVAGSFVCNCYEGWSSTHCNVTAPITGAGTGGSGVHPAAIAVPVIIAILLLCEFLGRNACMQCIDAAYCYSCRT